MLLVDKTPDNGGTDCHIDVKCSGLKEARPGNLEDWGWKNGGWGGSRRNANQGKVAKYDKMVDQACASDEDLPEDDGLHLACSGSVI